MLQIEANQRISPKTKFDIDLLLRQGSTFVCVEIEKSDMARFEFDILKMQAFASQCKERHPEARIFGAFIVPTENVVARHISGNSGESSYKYLTRLSKLVAQVKPTLIEDILILGYGRTSPHEKQGRRKPKKSARKSGLLKIAGLIPDKDLPWLPDYSTELLGQIRTALASGCPELMEKSNPNSQYLGYARGNASDAAYIYVQRKGLVIDLDVSVDRVEQLTVLGFEVKPRENFQAKAGWLTGLRVPYDTDKHQEIVSLLLEALTKNA